MATSGSFVTNIISGGGVSRRLQFAWSLSSQDIAGNYSQVYWELKGDYSTGWMYGQNFYAVVDGSRTNSTAKRQVTNGLLIASGTKTVYHDSAGNGSFSASAGGELYNYGTPNSTGSGSWELTSIPRTSSFTAPTTFNAGSSIKVDISRASTAFTHWVILYHGSTAIYSSGASNVGTTTTFTPDNATLLNIMSNTTSTVLKLQVDTYSGSSFIGRANQNITAYVPDSVVPSFSTITHSDADATTRNNIGSYVQSKSRLQIAMTGASAGQGAWVTAYRLTVDGQALNASSGTTGVIGGSGTLGIVGTVTDSRGRSASKTVNVSVLAYTPPSITSVKAYRVNSAGAVDSYGTFAKFELGFSITSLGDKNTKGVKVIVGSNNTMTVPTTFSGTHVVQYSGFNVNNSYPVTFYVGDLYGSTESPQVLPNGAVTMVWGKDNVAIGTTALKESASLNVGGEVYSKGVNVRVNFCGDLPAGNLLTIAYWANIRTGTHFIAPSAGLVNSPVTWGFAEVIKTSEGAGSNFSVLVHEQASGRMFRTGGNQNGMAGWSEIAYKSDSADTVHSYGANWTRWNSGKQEVWGSYNYGTVNFNLNPFGGVATSSVVGNETNFGFSVPFNNPPESVQLTGQSYGWVQFAQTNKTATHIGVRIWNSYVASVGQCKVDWYAVGKWK